MIVTNSFIALIPINKKGANIFRNKRVYIIPLFGAKVLSSFGLLIFAVKNKPKV